MKIDFVTDTYGPDINGVAMTLGRLAEGMKGRGHRVHVVRTGEGRNDGETGVASIGLPRYQEVRVGLPGPFLLRRRWTRRRPDAIYVATESPLGISAMKVAKELGIPVAAGFHTNFHQYMEQYRLGRLQPTAMSYLRRAHARAAVTLVPSVEVLEMLRGEGFGKVVLMGRGVDTDLFQPEKRSRELRKEWGVDEAGKVVLVVGRVAAEKNLGLAMESLRRMRSRDARVCGVCVGDGPVRKSLAERYPEVRFVGTKTGEDLAVHYASGDILLFPSETETFGNVLLEGMASGLVTVSYDYAAAGRYVAHGINGLKARKGEAEEFLDCGERALLESEGVMREQARDSVMALGWDGVVDVFEGTLAEIAAQAPMKLTRKVKKRVEVRRYRTIFLSDLHLGTPDSKVAEVVDFLEHTRCEKLVLNGDIVDGWALKRGSKWKKRHSRFIRKVLAKIEKEDIEVVYCRGNHDDILDRFLPMALGKLSFCKEHVHEGMDGKRYLVVHGDGFDGVSTSHRWLAWLGAIGYDSLLSINRVYNKYRAWRGREYFSLSKKIKAKVKSAVSFIGNYEEQLQNFARKRNCDGIICGHIHTPADKMIEGVRYLNSGDWVESLTAIVEHLDGRMELISYEEFLSSLAEEVRGLGQERKVVG